MQNNQITTSAAGATQPANETKHTPGPWLASDYMDHSPLPRSEWPSTDILSRDVHRLGGVPVALAGCDTAHRSLAEQRANARLIAAAPEMLAALKSLMADAQAPGIHYIEDSDFAAACAAIAKAEGRAL